MSKRAIILALLVICIIATVIRVLPAGSVFGGSYVSFIETDAYSRMYYAQQIAAMPFSDALTYTVSNNLLFSGLVAAAGTVLPIETAGAVLPVVLGVATVALVYLLGSRLFGPPVGLMAAAFTAVIPSEFLHRTLLGFADHHALEVFLLVGAIYCIVRAWQALARPWAWVGGASVALVLYALNWKAGLTMYGMILGVAGILWILKHRQHAKYAAAAVVIALVMYLPLGGWTTLTGLLPGGTETAAMATQEIIGTVASDPATQTIGELRPLLYPGRTFDLRTVTSNLHLFAIVLFFGGWFVLRDRTLGRPTKVLMLVWSLVMLAGTLIFRRNLYYFTINVALLSAFATWHIAGYIRGNRVVQSALLALPLVLMSLPGALNLGMNPQYSMSPEWHAALSWLNNQQVSGHVTAWSDYGHWIKYVTGDDPNYLPGPGARGAALLFLSTDDADAHSLMEALDTDYLICDTPDLIRKSIALTMVAGKTPPLEQTLMYRLWHRQDPQPDLELAYESQNIRIFKYTGG